MATPTGEQSSQMFSGGAAQATAALQRAVRAAKRAGTATRSAEESIPVGPVDWGSLDASAWKRLGICTAFRMRGHGTVLFTAGRDVVRESDADGRARLMVLLHETVDGEVLPVSVERLLQESDGVLTGVLTIEPRRGAAAPSLRVHGRPAVLSPCPGEPLVREVALSVNKGDPQRMPLQQAIGAMGLRWEPLQGRAATAATAGDAGAAPRTGRPLPTSWLAGALGEPKLAKRRASQLRTMGVCVSADTRGAEPRDVAQFLAATAGDMSTVDAVQAALGEALAAEGQGEGAEGAGYARVAEAGRACVAALRDALDALGADGAMEVMEESGAMRAATGVRAGPAARGSFASEALAARAQEEEAGGADMAAAAAPAAATAAGAAAPTAAAATTTAAAATRAPAGAGGTRPAAPDSAVGTAPTGRPTPESPLSELIRRVTAECGELREERARLAGGARAINFDKATDESAALTPRAGDKRTAEQAALHTPGAQATPPAGSLEGLRPAGAEEGNDKGVIAAIEAAMGCEGKLHLAFAEAVGRPTWVAALFAAGSPSAVEGAAEDWRALLQRAGGATALWGAEPPLGWSSAARRVGRVLTHVATAGTGGTGSGAQPDTPHYAAPRAPQGKEATAGTTARLTALKANAGEAGRRACAASVLVPLTTPAVVAREAGMPPQPDGVRAVARLVAEPGYGDAAWAAIYSNAKYTGTLPGEGAVPASVVAARELLASLLLERVEEEVGEERVGDVRDEMAALVEAVMTADIALKPAVKLLGGRRPYHTESRAGSYDGSIAVGRWGTMEGESAAADIAAAMGVLGDLLHDAHCAAGQGVAHADPSFGLGQLARQACAGDGSLDPERGLRLFEEVFRRLTRAAGRRRSRAGAAALDVGAIVQRVLDVDLQTARNADLMVRTAREAALQATGGGGDGGRRASGGGDGAGTVTGATQEKDRQRASRLLASVKPPPPPPAPPHAHATGATTAAAEPTAEEQEVAARLGLAAPPTLARGSIYMKCGRHGGVPGAVQAFNFLCALREPAARGRGELPCAWATLFGTCAPTNGVCDNCRHAETVPQAKRKPPRATSLTVCERRARPRCRRR